jgi:hypothetical protein
MLFLLGFIVGAVALWAVVWLLVCAIWPAPPKRSSHSRVWDSL